MQRVFFRKLQILESLDLVKLGFSQEAKHIKTALSYETVKNTRVTAILTTKLQKHQQLQ